MCLIKGICFKAERAQGEDPSLPASKECGISWWSMGAHVDAETRVQPGRKVRKHIASRTQASPGAGRTAGPEVWDHGDPKALSLQARKRGLERGKEWSSGWLKQEGLFLHPCGQDRLC